MESLPLELLSAIVKYVGKDGERGLAALRLVTRRLSLLATPDLFRVVTFTRDPRSAQTILNLHSCKTIVGLVQKIVFDGDASHSDAWEHTFEGIVAVFSQLEKFPALTSLELNFHPIFEEEDSWTYPMNPTSHLCLQLEVLTALARNPSTLKLASLSLHNLLPYNHDCYESPEFVVILSRISSLSISVIHDDPGGVYCYDPVVDFWSNCLVNVLDSATSLTSLTMRSDLLVGIGPNFPWQNITAGMPQLESLTLDRFHLSHKLADFLLRRGHTIRKFKINNCRMDSYEEFPQGLMLWGELWRRFREELMQLVGLEVDCMPLLEYADINPVVARRKMGYTRLDRWGFYDNDSYIPGEEHDDQEYEELLAAVQRRRQHSEASQDAASPVV